MVSDLSRLGRVVSDRRVKGFSRVTIIERRPSGGRHREGTAATERDNAPPPPNCLAVRPAARW